MPQRPAISASESEYVRVPCCVLKTLDRASVDLYLKYDSKKPPILFRSAGYPFAEDAEAGSAQFCPESLYVRARDYADLSIELRHSLDETLGREDLAVTDRYELLQCAVSLEVEQSLCMVSSDHYVNKIKTIGRQIVGLISGNKVVPSDLFDIVRHDHHTFVHVTNVAGYVTLLAKEMGITDRQELEKIAVGGLLHDLGKRQISKLILNKTQ